MNGRPLQVKRILVAAEMEDGTLVVYELDTHGGLVTIDREDVMTHRYRIGFDHFDEQSQFWDLRARGRLTEVRRGNVADYFEERPAVEPAQVALNP